MPAEPGEMPENDPVAHACLLLRNIRLQAEIFPELKAADPAWPMMLDLLIQARSGRPVSVQGACLASGAAETTALRHLAQLVDAGDVVRMADPSDRRRCWLRLSPAAEDRLLGYLAKSAMLE